MHDATVLGVWTIHTSDYSYPGLFVPWVDYSYLTNITYATKANVYTCVSVCLTVYIVYM